MKLSQNPESVAIRLDVPFHVALGFCAAPEEAGSRHAVEKMIQDYFYDLNFAAYVSRGNGPVIGGMIFIHTDFPAISLRELKRFFKSFKVHGTQFDFLPYVHLAWLDAGDRLWRTYFPQTTRPFWTFFADPQEVAALMEKGRAAK